jgi:hypothetical protein
MLLFATALAAAPPKPNDLVLALHMDMLGQGAPPAALIAAATATVEHTGRGKGLTFMGHAADCAAGTDARCVPNPAELVSLVAWRPPAEPAKDASDWALAAAHAAGLLVLDGHGGSDPSVLGAAMAGLLVGYDIPGAQGNEPALECLWDLGTRLREPEEEATLGRSEAPPARARHGARALLLAFEACEAGAGLRAARVPAASVPGTPPPGAPLRDTKRLRARLARVESASGDLAGVDRALVLATVARAHLDAVRDVFEGGVVFPTIATPGVTDALPDLDHAVRLGAESVRLRLLPPMRGEALQEDLLSAAMWWRGWAAAEQKDWGTGLELAKMAFDLEAGVTTQDAPARRYGDLGDFGLAALGDARGEVLRANLPDAASILLLGTQSARHAPSDRGSANSWSEAGVQWARLALVELRTPCEGVSPAWQARRHPGRMAQTLDKVLGFQGEWASDGAPRPELPAAAETAVSALQKLGVPGTLACPTPPWPVGPVGEARPEHRARAAGVRLAHDPRDGDAEYRLRLLRELLLQLDTHTGERTPAEEIQTTMATQLRDALYDAGAGAAADAWWAARIQTEQPSQHLRGDAVRGASPHASAPEIWFHDVLDLPVRIGNDALVISTRDATVDAGLLAFSATILDDCLIGAHRSDGFCSADEDLRKVLLPLPPGRYTLKVGRCPVEDFDLTGGFQAWIPCE